MVMCSTVTCCIAHGTLLNVVGQPGCVCGQRVWGENGHMFARMTESLIVHLNYHNIAHQLYPNTKKSETLKK